MVLNKPFYLFLGKAFLLYVGWNILYYSWLNPKTAFEEKMTIGVATISSMLLQWEGYDAFITNSYSNEGSFAYSEVVIDHEPSILIANPCNGVTLLALFIGFIIAYPGEWKVKSIYILVGSLLIYLINLIRIQILIFNYLHSQNSFEFNHKYTYTICVYSFVFLLWIGWVNYYSKRKEVVLKLK